MTQPEHLVYRSLWQIGKESSTARRRQVGPADDRDREVDTHKSPVLVVTLPRPRKSSPSAYKDFRQYRPHAKHAIGVATRSSAYRTSCSNGRDDGDLVHNRRGGCWLGVHGARGCQWSLWAAGVMGCTEQWEGVEGRQGGEVVDEDGGVEVESAEKNHFQMPRLSKQCVALDKIQHLWNSNAHLDC